MNGPLISRSRIPAFTGLKSKICSGAGGSGYAYYIEVVPAGRFAIGLKADAATREKYLLEPVKNANSFGALALDLQVQRFGYDGPIELAFESPLAGLQLHQAIIPAKANDARSIWWRTVSGIAELARYSSSGQNDEGSGLYGATQYIECPEAQESFTTFPANWMDGNVVVSGVASSESFFDFERTPIRLPRVLREHSVVLPLKRLQAEFKDAVSVLSEPHPQSWSLSSTVDKDNYTWVITRPASDPGTATDFGFTAYGEWKGRGKFERIQIPIEWFDPIEVYCEPEGSWIAGQSASLRFRVRRSPEDPQPIQLRTSQSACWIIGA